eukprot:CAMPEP_0178991718 /NCGR_PEP_ID=MMETSP0795-20121207/5694_1 /TAXON_ID=88552 /ORGANISM="Amoebophrya sp., Strain Ameob2" /LENGTH=299 /DNA_ID=CAMNT_0020683479 /DNA_START=540 /DNA_END=1439 /DNA_ORIENTATION=+
MATFCGWYQGGVDTFIYGLYSRFGRHMAPLRFGIASALFDNFVHVPVGYLPAFYLTLGAVQSQSWEEIKREMRNTYFQSWAACCTMWVPFQFVNFYFIPERFRVLFVNCACLVWNVIIDYINHRGAGPAVAGVVGGVEPHHKKDKQILIDDQDHHHVHDHEVGEHVSGREWEKGRMLDSRTAAAVAEVVQLHQVPDPAAGPRGGERPWEDNEKNHDRSALHSRQNHRDRELSSESHLSIPPGPMNPSIEEEVLDPDDPLPRRILLRASKRTFSQGRGNGRGHASPSGDHHEEEQEEEEP